MHYLRGVDSSRGSAQQLSEQRTVGMMTEFSQWVILVVIGLLTLAVAVVSSNVVRPRVWFVILFPFRQTRNLWRWANCRWFNRHTWRYIDGPLSFRRRIACWVCGVYKCDVTGKHKWTIPPPPSMVYVDQNRKYFQLHIFQCEQCPKEVEKKQYDF